MPGPAAEAVLVGGKFETSPGRPYSTGPDPERVRAADSGDG